MSQNEDSGYKGEALEALKKAECEVGDIIRVNGEGKTYEGILIPRSIRRRHSHCGQDEKRLQHRNSPLREREN